VLLAEVEKAGIQVSDAEVTNALAQLTGGISDPAAVAARAGVPVEVVIDDIRKNAAFEKLLSSATNDLPALSDADVRAKFDELRAKDPSAFPDRPETVTASHILVEARKGVATPEQDAAALEKIKGLRERALAGEDFAALARENSDCPSKNRGGNLGSFPRGQMVKEFDEAAFAQPVGEIGEIVKTQFGYHIIKVTARQEAKPLDFDADVAPRLRLEMEREAAGKAISARVKELRDAAGVEILSATVVSDAVAIPPAPPAKEEAAPAKE
jgi:peptidyl-prolyl cis-trans isomerase C